MNKKEEDSINIHAISLI